MREIIGVDFYNQTTTGGVGITLRAAAGGTDTTPCIIEKTPGKSIEEGKGNELGRNADSTNADIPQRRGGVKGCQTKKTLTP